MCEYVEGSGFYCDWINDYVETHESCIMCSTIDMAGEQVLISRKDFMIETASLGIILTGIILWVWFKAIL